MKDCLLLSMAGDPIDQYLPQKSQSHRTLMYHGGGGKAGDIHIQPTLPREVHPLDKKQQVLSCGH